jgi:hypothetical protein
MRRWRRYLGGHDSEQRRPCRSRSNPADTDPHAAAVPHRKPEPVAGSVPDRDAGSQSGSVAVRLRRQRSEWTDSLPNADARAVDDTRPLAAAVSDQRRGVAHAVSDRDARAESRAERERVLDRRTERAAAVPDADTRTVAGTVPKPVPERSALSHAVSRPRERPPFTGPRPGRREWWSVVAGD